MGDLSVSMVREMFSGLVSASRADGDKSPSSQGVYTAIAMLLKTRAEKN